MHFYRNLSISNSVFWAVRKVLERSRNACTQCWNAAGMRTGTLCAHPYCIPALLACISTTFQYFMRAFLLHSIAFLFHSITFLLHFHCISITFPLHFHCISYALHFHCISFPALLACINIIPCFILALTLFLVLTLFLAFTHVCILILLIQALFWLHLHNVPVLTSTFLFVHFYCACLLHFYCFLLTQILDLGLKEGPLNHFILLCGGMLRVKTLPKQGSEKGFRFGRV